MGQVSLVTLASGLPMGQQLHELALAKALRVRADGDWIFTSAAVSPLRAKTVNGIRLPLRLLERLPHRLAAKVGDRVYGRASLVHLFDLRCVPRSSRQVVTIHDLPPLRFPDEGRLPAFAASSARQSDAVICPSEFAAVEVKELLGVERVRVIPNGLEAGFLEARRFDEGETADLGVRGRVVLHVGGATLRKNLAELARAWVVVRQRCPDAVLVLCGPDDPRRRMLFDDLPGTVLLGYRSPDFIARMMATAVVVVVPSLYEGFGLPAIEAMAAGTPVVAARAGALPEVCGDAAMLVNPTAKGLADAVIHVLEDDATRNRLHALGRRRALDFSWDRAAEATLQVYREVLGP